MPSFRIQKVADVLHKEISALLRTEISDPGVGFVTITGVEVSKDIRNAKVFVSVMGDAAQKQASMKALERARTFIQNLLGERVRLRFVPILRFHLDESIEYGSRIDAILNRLSAERSANDVQTQSETE
jgi:ribosome-binding factor A